jgi:hypothetical protein
MSELTREKKCQIAALAAKGWKAEGIAEIAKVDIEAVKALLATRDTEKTAEPLKEDISAMNRTELKAYAVRLYNQGKKHKEIMEITGLSRSVLYTLIPVGKDSKDKNPRKFKKAAQVNKDFDQAVDEMIAEAETKKEPAPAATDTSSTSENINSLYPNDTIDEPKSQALSGISGSNNIEAALEEWLGNEKEIVYLKADTESAEVRFKYDGRIYSMTFGRYA